MSQYANVRILLAKQRQQERKLPAANLPPDSVKAQLERVKAEIAARRAKE